MAHAIELTVRGYHLDLFRHVNNARYLEFLEEARWSFLEHHQQIDFIETSGYSFAVVNININYRRAAYMNNVLRITTGIKSIGQRSCVMYQAITLKDTGVLIADVDVTFVIIDLKTERAAPLEGPLLEMLEHMRAVDAVDASTQ